MCLLHFGDWMSNDEPKKRPSIWKARRRFSALRVWMKSTQWLYMYLRKTWAYVARFHPMTPFTEPTQGRGDGFWLEIYVRFHFMISPYHQITVMALAAY